MFRNIFLIFIFFSSGLFAQEPLWERTTGGKYADFLTDGISTMDYGFLLAGSTLSDAGNIKNRGSYDYLLTKYTEDGDKEWSKLFGGLQTDLLRCILPDQDGGFLLGGISNSPEGGIKSLPGIGQFDIWLIKLDLDGNILWQRVLGGLASEDLSDIVSGVDGGYLIGGSSLSAVVLGGNKKESPSGIIPKQSLSYGHEDYWLIKLDASGQIQWQKSYGGSRKDVLKKIIPLREGGYILAGESGSPAGGIKNTSLKGGNDWWIIRIDMQGNILWQRTFGDEAEDILSSAIPTKDGNFLLGGYYTYIDTTSAKNTSDIVLRKIDIDGNLLWKEVYTGSTDDYLTGLLENPDGSLILGAYSAGLKKGKKSLKGKGTEDFLLIKTGENGQELWRQSIGGIGKEVLKKVLLTRDGGYVLLGSSIAPGGKADMQSDFYMVKIGDKDKPVKEKFPLEAIPNPAVLYTQAIIGRDYEKGRFRLFDLNGKVLEERELKGERIIPINMSRYPNGIYLINVRADDYNKSIKVLKSSH